MDVDPSHPQIPVEGELPTHDVGSTPRPLLAKPRLDLHAACTLGDLAAIRWALVCGADASMLDQNGFRPLHLVATAGNVAGLELLLRSGARANQTSEVPGTFRGCTPLHVATAVGHADVVEALLLAGARVHLRDEAGLTPLHTAALAGHAHIVKQLLLAGACPEPYLDDQTPLDLAHRAGHGEVVGLLRQVTGRR